jgi:hypothetical protein
MKLAEFPLQAAVEDLDFSPERTETDQEVLVDTEPEGLKMIHRTIEFEDLTSDSDHH